MSVCAVAVGLVDSGAGGGTGQTWLSSQGPGSSAAGLLLLGSAGVEEDMGVCVQV